VAPTMRESERGRTSFTHGVLSVTVSQRSLPPASVVRPVTNAKQFAISLRMSIKDLEEVMERVRHWPKERQEDAAEILLEMERQDASGYRLTDAQAEEVVRIRREIREGRGTFATDEQMAALWKSCGL
jgi:hypothetical protein